MSYTLQHLLTRSARCNPDSDALICGSARCTYGEMDALSNRVASVLRSAGIVRGDRVGLCLGKSIESVAAIFGIMKAGAAYVPLDPAAPVKRVAYIIDNCRVKALVSSRKNIESLPKLSSLESVISVDGNSEHSPDTAPVIGWSEVLAASPGEPPDPELIEDDLAYILYTSGSTGSPKGVMISHRASLTFVDWAHGCFGITSEDRVSSHAPFHFDLSVFDLFVTVKAGGTVVCVPPSLSLFPRSLARFIADNGITVWYSVPSALSRLAGDGDLTQFDFSRLRTVLFAGEVFPVRHLRNLMSQVPGPAYYNLYGPTETNVCTWYRAPSLEPERIEPLPIGRACANSEVFVLDEKNEPAPRGTPGELCVRGPGLMKAYWGLPDETRQVLHLYRLDPWSTPELIYRTGDLVRQDSSGEYIFIGRRDNMIKSRGYRIELNEIEAALYSHPDVEEASAIAIPDTDIGNRIEAAIVLRKGRMPKAGSIEACCAERIPKYMIPDRILYRDALPKTSTGKIDRVLLRQQTLLGQETTETLELQEQTCR